MSYQEKRDPSLSCHRTFLDTSYDGNFMANVGWEETSRDHPVLQFLFSSENIEQMSQAISRALEGVDPQGRTIRVSNEAIAGVLSSVYRFGTRSQIGDIHSRFIVPQEQLRCDVQSIVTQSLNIIITQLKNQIEMEAYNKTLTVWTTVLGDFNDQGLRSHAPIKIRRRHPQYMAFQMNY